jgi:hypothetical protein
LRWKSATVRNAKSAIAAETLHVTPAPCADSAPRVSRLVPPLRKSAHTNAVSGMSLSASPAL